MFDRNRCPTGQPPTCDGMLAEMAHAMGCGTLACDDRQARSAFLRHSPQAGGRPTAPTVEASVPR